MRIVVDQNTDAEIIQKPLANGSHGNGESNGNIDYIGNYSGSNSNNHNNHQSNGYNNGINNIINGLDEIHPNLDKNISLMEYQYVPNVILNGE